jgi:hypothetical protein
MKGVIEALDKEQGIKQRDATKFNPRLLSERTTDWSFPDLSGNTGEKGPFMP